MGLSFCSQSLSQYQNRKDYEVFDPSAWNSLYYHLKEGNPVYRKKSVSGAHDQGIHCFLEITKSLTSHKWLILINKHQFS